MIVIPPLTITDAMVTSSTVAEPDAGETVWNAATSYALADLAYLAANHTVYERLVAGTTATSPDLDTVNWAAYGKTNKWAMFDVYRNTATVETTSPLTVVVTPGQRVDSIFLGGLVANTVDISITSSAVVVYTATVDLDNRIVGNWYEYFFAPFTTKPSVALFDLPPYSNAIITVTIAATSGDVECGALVVGMQEDIGTVKYQAESDVLNFSTVERDIYGTSSMVQRRNVPKTIQSIYATKERVNAVRALRDALNATPAVWAGLDDSDEEYFEALLILGFYRRFSINLSHIDYAEISLELEEV